MKQPKKKESHKAIQTKIFNKGIKEEIDKLKDPDKGYRKNAIFTFFKKEKQRESFVDALTSLGYTDLNLSIFQGFAYPYVVCFCGEEPLWHNSPEALSKHVLYLLMVQHFKAHWEMYSKAAQN